MAVTSQTELVGEIESPASGVIMADAASPGANLDMDVQVETPQSDTREISGMYDDEQKADFMAMYGTATRGGPTKGGPTKGGPMMTHAPSSLDDGVMAMYGTKTG